MFMAEPDAWAAKVNLGDADIVIAGAVWAGEDDSPDDSPDDSVDDSVDGDGGAQADEAGPG